VVDGAVVSGPARHGGAVEVPLEALADPDPELALARADMGAWSDAHPCTCPGDAGLHEPGCPQA
jgi:hypothetical protein